MDRSTGVMTRRCTCSTSLNTRRDRRFDGPCSTTRGDFVEVNVLKTNGGERDVVDLHDHTQTPCQYRLGYVCDLVYEMTPSPPECRNDAARQWDVRS